MQANFTFSCLRGLVFLLFIVPFFGLHHSALAKSEINPSSKAITILEQNTNSRIDIKETQNPDVIPLSLNSVILFALSDNPDVRMSLEREKQASANTKKAKSGFYPLIDLAVQSDWQYNNPAPNAEDGGSSNTSSQKSFTMKQVVFDFGKTVSNYRSQKKLQESAKLDTEVNVEDTLNITIENYLQILRYQRTLKDSEVFISRIRDLVKKVEEMYEAGGTSKTTLSYAQSRLSAAELKLNIDRSSLNDSISSLEFLTGKLPIFIASSPDELDPSRLDIYDYIQYSSTNNTSIKLANSDIEARKHKLKATKRAKRPTFNFLLSGDESFNDGGEVGKVRSGKAILQMNYRLFDGYAQRAQVELVSSQISEMKIGREKALRDLNKKIKLAYYQLKSMGEEKQYAQAEIAYSEALQNLNRENFKLGSISIIELIEGEERLDAAYTKLHKLDSDMYANTYHLLIIAGYLKKTFFCQTCNN
ncbi:MAG: TolC family protein [Alphaproteobacteria bacterium]|nr:TolC family protein [Alphaproteobacteria bacterium]MCK5554765.1 TolC family protein [Alphaproteobacteria bacterium]